MVGGAKARSRVIGSGSSRFGSAESGSGAASFGERRAADLSRGSVKLMVPCAGCDPVFVDAMHAVSRPGVTTAGWL